MHVSCDIEANGLENPTEIWVIVCVEIDTEVTHIFRNLTSDQGEKERFLVFSKGVTLWIGNNFIEYDARVINDLLGLDIPLDNICDTLVISRMENYNRPGGHSIEAWGITFDLPKGSIKDFSMYTLAMEEYCVRDAKIGCLVYLHLLHFISDPTQSIPIAIESRWARISWSVHRNGFAFNATACTSLKEEIVLQLIPIDEEIQNEFPRTPKAIREVTPKYTKHGTLGKAQFKFVKDGDLSAFNGGPFTLLDWVVFNPASPKQMVALLNKAGWKPVNKTKTHIETERELNWAKSRKRPITEVDLASLHAKMETLKIWGWKVDIDNLSTLPENAPPSARLLAKRILLENRRRTLTEWLSLAQSDGRIHGRFFSIGTWTGRMAHREPNTGNITTGAKLYAEEMRSFWCAPKNRLLVGVDADAIQFRIAAHYINDPELIRKIVEGKKSDGTDPHSYNRRVIGEDICKSRDASKRSLFSLILGGREAKVAEILGCNKDGGARAIHNLIQEYPGIKKLREEIVVEDAKRGYFIGLDGRKVLLPGDTVSERKHLAPSGYLQNGEKVIMAHAGVLWHDRLYDIRDKWLFVNMVHDEYQTECVNDMAIALRIAQTQAQSIADVGVMLGCRCPLAGSYFNDKANDYTIGRTWKETH